MDKTTIIKLAAEAGILINHVEYGILPQHKKAIFKFAELIKEEINKPTEEFSDEQA